MLAEALLWAVLGGAAMGTYPLFIRTPAVLRARPHTVVFQLYKSSCVFLSGFLFLIPRYLAWHGAGGKHGGKHGGFAGAPLFVFNWWAFLSAAFWIPAGLFTIFSVPIVGVGLQVALAASTSSVVTFLVFWLAFGTRMKSYSCGDGCAYYLAPLYLVGTVCGMVALIFSAPLADRLRRWCGGCPAARAAGVAEQNNCSSRSLLAATDNTDSNDERYFFKGPDTTVINDAGARTSGGGEYAGGVGKGGDGSDGSDGADGADDAGRPLLDASTGGGYAGGLDDDMVAKVLPPENASSSSSSSSLPRYSRWAAGVFLSMCGGCSASGQYAVVQQGKKIEELRAHCFPQNVTCPPALVESFDTFGSWYVSFGIGALAVTLVLLAGLALTRGGKCPKFHWRVLRVAGVQAGGFWVVGNFFTTLAVVRGGNAVVLAQTLSTMIITSGLWGLVYYKEGDQSTLRKGVWFAAAAFTLASMILLGEEKVKVAA